MFRIAGPLQMTFPWGERREVEKSELFCSGLSALGKAFLYLYVYFIFVLDINISLKDISE